MEASHILMQEQTLTLPQFDASVAWTLGAMLHDMAVERGHAVVIDIRRFGRPSQPLFYAAMPGTTPDNARWARRKSNVVARYHRSSYAIGLKLEAQGQTITERHALPASGYATVGGSFPVAVAAAGGVVGSITVSGLASKDDHELIVEALCVHLGRDYAEFKLP